MSLIKKTEAELLQKSNIKFTINWHYEVEPCDNMFASTNTNLNIDNIIQEFTITKTNNTHALTNTPLTFGNKILSSINYQFEKLDEVEQLECTKLKEENDHDNEGYQLTKLTINYKLKDIRCLVNPKRHFFFSDGLPLCNEFLLVFEPIKNYRYKSLLNNS